MHIVFFISTPPLAQHLRKCQPLKWNETESASVTSTPPSRSEIAWWWLSQKYPCGNGHRIIACNITFAVLSLGFRSCYLRQRATWWFRYSSDFQSNGLITLIAHTHWLHGIIIVWCSASAPFMWIIRKYLSLRSGGPPIRSYIPTTLRLLVDNHSTPAHTAT